MTLAHYCTLFSRLNRAPGPMWDATTRHRAPHKPLLLLAVMNLVARGVVTSRVISITGELVELNELFTGDRRSSTSAGDGRSGPAGRAFAGRRDGPQCIL